MTTDLKDFAPTPTPTPIATHGASVTPDLPCVICQTPFQFRAGESALVLRHVAYGYDFVHEGACFAAASDAFFVEPGYDCAAFGPDPERRRVLGVAAADGWLALSANTSESFLARQVRFDPLRNWAVIEHQDGSIVTEGLVRDEEWLDEPGGAEFPEAVRGSYAFMSYASPASRLQHSEARAA
jgi:hypothetical protein